MHPYLEKVREAEIETVRSWFSHGLRVLEVGGGSGYQARVMASWGCHVSAIDLPTRPAPQAQHYPVEDYDGTNIPFANESFDIVFSSNVLEHIQSLPPILAEMRRVLKPGGVAIHILPSSTWRLWTILSHYVYLLKRLSGMQQTVPGLANVTSTTEVLNKYGLAYTLKLAIFATSHGEYPNALSELYYYSKRRWIKVFAENGFKVRRTTGTGLFYTAYGLLPGLSLKARFAMARFLGSSCHIYGLQKSRTS